jgi:hypothetical protein
MRCTISWITWQKTISLGIKTAMCEFPFMVEYKKGQKMNFVQYRDVPTSWNRNSSLIVMKLDSTERGDVWLSPARICIQIGWKRVICQRVFVLEFTSWFLARTAHVRPLCRQIILFFSRLLASNSHFLSNSLNPALVAYFFRSQKLAGCLC